MGSVIKLQEALSKTYINNVATEKVFVISCVSDPKGDLQSFFLFFENFSL